MLLFVVVAVALADYSILLVAVRSIDSSTPDTVALSIESVDFVDFVFWSSLMIIRVDCEAIDSIRKSLNKSQSLS